MNAAFVEKIAKAVLYEGYMLYPYRPSAVKNRQRFNFGVVYPRAYNQAHGETEPWTFHTDCLAEAEDNGAIEVRLRFLQLVDRSLAAFSQPANEVLDEGALHPVPSLEVDGRVLRPWQEAIEQEVRAAPLELEHLCSKPARVPFNFPAAKHIAPVRDTQGQQLGAVARTREELGGEVLVSAVPVRDRVYRIILHVSNQSQCAADASRDAALISSLVSTHFVLGIEHGAFVSLLETPGELREVAAGCRNSALWPILVGTPGERDTLLCSPIILYDYPQIAPESPGDLFDSTEIDEILSLRILTMTDEEKREMRESDERARQILERTESLPAEQWMKLHGAVRSLRPQKEKAS